MAEEGTKLNITQFHVSAGTKYILTKNWIVTARNFIEMEPKPDNSNIDLTEYKRKNI